LRHEQEEKDTCAIVWHLQGPGGKLQVSHMLFKILFGGVLQAA